MTRFRSPAAGSRQPAPSAERSTAWSTTRARWRVSNGSLALLLDVGELIGPGGAGKEGGGRYDGDRNQEAAAHGSDLSRSSYARSIEASLVPPSDRLQYAKARFASRT